MYQLNILPSELEKFCKRLEEGTYNEADRNAILARINDCLGGDMDYQKRLEELTESLITRDKFRETLNQECNKQEFQPTIVDDNNVMLYSVDYYIKKFELKFMNSDDMERFYIAPARISIVREFVTRKQNVHVGEPRILYVGEEGDRVIFNLYMPVLVVPGD